MNIKFSGNYSINPETFGINFEVIVDGQKFICKVSNEALQDVNPSTTNNTPEQQFLANQSMFEILAEKKIRTGATSPIGINSSDVLHK